MVSTLVLLPRHVVRHYDNGEEDGDGEGVDERHGCDEGPEGEDGEKGRRGLRAVGRGDDEGRHEHGPGGLAIAERTGQTYKIKCRLYPSID